MLWSLRVHVRYGLARAEGGSVISGRGMTGIGMGILCWVATQAVASGLAGAGHGWVGPLFLLVPLLLLYPLAFVHLMTASVGGCRGDAIMLALAAALDLGLCYNVQIQEAGYFARLIDVAPGLLWTWFALWIGWQAAAIVTALRHGRGKALREGVA